MIDADERTIEDFHRLYYQTNRMACITYRGVELHKYPTDLWIYQEIIRRCRPSVIIETGTFMGGSAMFLIDQMKSEHGYPNCDVITIDVKDWGLNPDTTITKIIAPSVPVPDAVHSIAFEGRKVMVVLDSDHSEAYVAQELEAYAPLVTPGQYLIVEDTNLAGNPVFPDWPDGGPGAAVKEFLTRHDEFEVDRECEKLYLTANPGGYLRRKA